MILAAAWAFGWMIETIPWGRLAAWTARNYVRGATLAFFGFLAVLTGRDAFRASYINYDDPTEYLVYAHGAPLPKELFGQIEELSIRTTGTIDGMVAAYDNWVRYPYWWYMRRYANKIDYDVNPTRDLRRALVIAVGDQNLTKITPVVRQDYFEFAGMRLWWPNMDYWSLKWSAIESERASILQKDYAGTDKTVPAMNILGYLEYAWPHIKPFFTDAQVRSAVLQIWFNDDFTDWGVLKNSTAYSLTDWGTSERMHYYIRKDISAQLWPYGASAQAVVTPVDPYAAITSPASPDLVLGTAGSEPGQFQSPRAVAVAADGSLYVVDSMNIRIQHLSQDGQVLQVWGNHADVSQGAAPGGTFNEPWGIAVAPDGSVYVADTWNYRIQKFTADGTFVTMWGFFGGASDAPEAFYGPRGLAVDAQGRVYVADTGNKRIVVFDPNGKYITQFGTPGMGLGQLDEPVAVALDAAGKVYVTDTWNQRVQVFVPDAAGLIYTATAEWPVDGWYGQSVENKPFIAVDTTGNVTVTDPELCRLITFSPGGQPLRVQDGCSAGTLLLPSGIASDGSGGLWVTNAGNGTLVHFKTQNP
jgi:DNA-binding beta-propeller fold protein YncE